MNTLSMTRYRPVLPYIILLLLTSLCLAWTAGAQAAENYADGIVTYKAEIDLEKLVPAMKEKFDVEGLRLDERHVVLHGVSRGTDLPESAQSVPGVPARMTLPVAFGEIELIRGGTDATAIRY